MTDPSKPQPPKITHLELNQETVQDLTDEESERAEGGAVDLSRGSCVTCHSPWCRSQHRVCRP